MNQESWKKPGKRRGADPPKKGALRESESRRVDAADCLPTEQLPAFRNEGRILWIAKVPPSIILPPSILPPPKRRLYCKLQYKMGVTDAKKTIGPTRTKANENQRTKTNGDGSPWGQKERGGGPVTVSISQPDDPHRGARRILGLS